LLTDHQILKTISNQRYSVKLADSTEEVEEALKLRYTIFYEELGRSFKKDNNKIDRDEFDEQCHHLLIKQQSDGRVIGTYRMQTFQQAGLMNGLYSNNYYDFDGVEYDILSSTVEVGRACIHPDHRNGRVLYLLWKGFAGYLEHYTMRYMMGSFGIPVSGRREALDIYDYFDQLGLMSEHVVLPVKEPYRIQYVAGEHCSESIYQTPPLLQNYFDVGCKICSHPAYVEDLNLLHVLLFLDIQTISPGIRKMFFEWIHA